MLDDTAPAVSNASGGSADTRQAAGVLATKTRDLRRTVAVGGAELEDLVVATAESAIRSVWAIRWQVLYVAATLVVLVVSFLDPDAAVEVHDPSLIPVVSAITVTLAFLVGLLLIGDYRAGGNPRMLVIGSAFLWAGAVSLIRLVVLELDVEFIPRGTAASSFAVWNFREVGFTAICGGAAVQWRQSIYDYVTDRRNRTRCTIVAAVGIAFASTIPTWWTIIRESADARLVEGGDFSRLAAVTGPVALPIAVACMCLAMWGYVYKRRGGTVGSWVGTACVVSTINVFIMFESGRIDSYGWIAARFSTMNILIVIAFVTMRRVRRDQRLADMYRSETNLIDLVANNAQTNAAEIARELDQIREALRHETVVRREVVTTVADKIELPVAELRMTLGASLDRLRETRERAADAEPRAAQAATALEREIARALDAIDTFGATVVAIRSQAQNVAETESLLVDRKLPSSVHLNVLLDLCAADVPEREIESFCDNKIEIRVEALPFQQVVVGLIRSLPVNSGPIELSAAVDRRDIEIEIRPTLDDELDAYWEPCQVSRALADKFGWQLECIEHEASYLLRIPALRSEYPARIG